MAIDEAKLNQFVMQAVGDFAATFHAGNVVIGEQLGLYKELSISCSRLGREVDAPGRALKRRRAVAKAMISQSFCVLSACPPIALEARV